MMMLVGCERNDFDQQIKGNQLVTKIELFLINMGFLNKNCVV